jgi:hypothetical protein
MRRTGKLYRRNLGGFSAGVRGGVFGGIFVSGGLGINNLIY